MGNQAATAGARPSLLARTARRAGRLFRRNPSMAVGVSIVLMVAIIAILAPVVSRFNPYLMSPAEQLQPPSADHWFGTDRLGRDVYARVIFGSRISLLVGSSVAVASMALGAILGLLSGYYRRLDGPIMRVMDGLMAFPSLLLAIALMAALGSTVQNVIIALVIVDFPRAVRVVRASTLTLREMAFIEAARSIGVPPHRILLLHIFPNTIAPLTIQGTFTFAAAVLVEASLSFLGAGVPPWVPSWGNIMSEGRNFIQVAMWQTLFPGIAIALTVLGINLTGDGLRDMLDPRLRGRFA